MSGAYHSKTYPNFFELAGYMPEETDSRLEKIFDTLFYGTPDERIFCPCGDDMGYIVDTGNIDARTEGMSYGMMMCVQLDHKEEFDRIWKWARKNMYLTEGRNRGFFCWSNALDGSRMADGAAPDGEEYFVMALFFASHRWGDGEGIYNYSSEACKLLHEMKREGDGFSFMPDKDDYPKGQDGPDPASLGRGMFDLDDHLIRFITDVDFTDPSYHLPHFYELFSMWAYPEDRDFYAKAAEASREYLHRACHDVTGLCAEYSYYDGRPFEKGQKIWGKHDWYYSDAYRTILNIALDHVWFDKDKWQEDEGRKFLSFMCDGAGVSNWNKVFDVDGTIRSEDALHPVAVIATNAAAAGLVNISDPSDTAADHARFCIDRFWNTPLRTGDRRYYDNCLYFFSFLLLSGRYRIY